MKIVKEDKKNMQQKGQLKTNQYTLIWVIAQFLVTLILIVVGIIGLLKGGIMLQITKVLLGVDFIIMAYNNKWVYNRNHFTILYFLVGILFIVLGICDMVGVI